MTRERVLVVGEGPALIGILTEPAAGLDPRRPVLLVLNSGLLPRSGPARSSVKAARRAAALGLAAVRFDLSGVGDSEARRDTASFEERWVGDTRAVMDHLEAVHGARRFVLMGLCSGADNSFQTAKRDPRVVGVVLLDGYAYKTPGYYARYYGRRLLDPPRVGAFARRALKGLVARAVRGRWAVDGASAPPRAEPQYVREFPPRDEVAADLRAMVARGVKLCVVHSGGMEIYFNHRSQFRDAFRDVEFGDALEVHHFADADHAFTELAQQELLHGAIQRFLRRHF